MSVIVKTICETEKCFFNVIDVYQQVLFNFPCLRYALFTHYHCLARKFYVDKNDIT